MHTLIDRSSPVSGPDVAEAIRQVLCADAPRLHAEFDAILTAARPLPVAAPPRRRVTPTAFTPVAHGGTATTAVTILKKGGRNRNRFASLIAREVTAGPARAIHITDLAPAPLTARRTRP